MLIKIGVVILILAGIAVSVILIRNPQVFNPQAAGRPGFPDLDPAKTLAYCEGNISRIHLEWNPVPGATLYKIYRVPTVGAGVKIAESGGTGYNDETVTPGTTYGYYVSAVTPAGDVDGSAEGRTAVNCTPSQSQAPAEPSPVNAPAQVVKPDLDPTKTLAYCNGTTSRIHLEWTSVPVATLYKIYRVPPQGAGVKIAESGGTGYNDEAATPGVTYGYYVSAVTPKGDVDGLALSRTAVTCTSTEKPDLDPVKSTTYCDNGITPRVHLEWKPVPTATLYKIYRVPVVGAGVKLAESGGTGYNDETVTPGTTYGYYVSATTPTGDFDGAALSFEVASCGSGGPGTGPVLDDAKTAAYCEGVTSRVHLEWSQVQGATLYKVFRVPPEGAGVKLADSGGTGYNDDTVTPETTYGYYVSATTPTGDVDGPAVARTAVSCSTSTPPPPNTVKTLAYCNGTIPRIHLEWNTVPGATLYKIFRVPQQGAGSMIGTTSGTGYNDDSLSANATFSYYVSAVTSGGDVDGKAATLTAPSCGLTQTPTPTPVSTALPSQGKKGDANRDGKVDVFDYSILLLNYDKASANFPELEFCSSSSPGCDPAKIDLFDYGLFINEFRKDNQ